jgi:molybdopterin-guanine dinucleotide biosynthesis protein MobB
VDRSPLVVSFVGPSGAGKTTLIEQLVPRLEAAGLAVGTLKHAPHGFDADRPGSDSWRHARAGARKVVLAGAGGIVVFVPDHCAPDGQAHHSATAESASPWLAGIVDAYLGDVDVVLAEGYAPACDVVVAVERHGIAPKAGTSETPWLVVSDTRPPADGVVALGDVDSIATRIVARHAG